jgi:predicted Zn-dependent peptidase
MTESTSFGLNFNSHEEVVNAMQQLSTKDIVNVASKLIKGKVAIAAVGQVGQVPYAEDLI